MKRLIIILATLVSAGSLSAQTIITADNLADTPSGPRIRIAAQGGWFYRFGKVDESLNQDTRNFYNKMKKGREYGADATFYLNSGYGIGVKYSKGSASNSIYGTVTYNDGTQETGTISDNIDLTFIGVYASASTARLGSKHIFFLNYGVGYLGYYEKSLMLDEAIMTGSTLATYGGLGYDYLLSDHLAIGAEITLLTGTLRAFTQTSDGQTQTYALNSDEALNVSHISADIGIRLYF
ncbi:MAG: hypothetical protein IKZ60_07860 [Bacteroidales bacterium]|nr:hypothetical protein [Bacteroidales bacterium]